MNNTDPIERDTERGAERAANSAGTDAPYTFGRPASTYLSPREIVRLTILRSKVRDSRLQFGPAADDEQRDQPEPAAESSE